MSQPKKPEHDAQPDVSGESPDAGRRDFLKKAGKAAAYTPPTVSLLMVPHVAAGASEGGA